MSATPPKLEDWLNATSTTEDDITAFAPTALAATLGSAPPAGVLPPLWHWLYFLPLSPLSEAGPDGHPKRGGFLPPVPLPRRMWAGGRLTFHAPLPIGVHARRRSTITRIEHKSGRSGHLVFVTVHHEIDADGVKVLDEEQDIVYRDVPTQSTGAGATLPAGTPAPADERWRHTLVADPVMLFRYSALTFNSHRIHYDHPYVTQQEGYPGLIVHGPFIATLLAGLVRRELPDATLRSFAFTAMRPTFGGNAFTLCGRPGADGREIALWARDHDGYLTMRATAIID